MVETLAEYAMRQLEGSVLAKLEDCGVSLDDSDDELRRAFATVVQPRKCFEIAKRLQLWRGN